MPHVVPQPHEFCQVWGQCSGVARYAPCPFMPSSLSCYPYFCDVISVSTVPLNSGIKSLSCGNGEQGDAGRLYWQYM